MDEREFWIQIRRGLSIVTAAIKTHHPDDVFWTTFLRGLNIAVSAIEARWKLPRSSIRPIGQRINEPPASPLAPTNQGDNERGI